MVLILLTTFCLPTGATHSPLLHTTMSLAGEYPVHDFNSGGRENASFGLGSQPSLRTNLLIKKGTPVIFDSHVLFFLVSESRG